MENYLHECLALAEQVRRDYYPEACDFETLERLGASIRSSRQLTYEDAARLLKPNSQFWIMPARSEFEDQIGNVQLDLWNLPRKEDSVIRDLLMIFRQIGPVSVILRFLHPEEYGIFSAPVVEILETHRELKFKGALQSTPQLYVSYLENLRYLRESRSFARVADVETALWALYEGVLRRGLPGTEHLGKAFWRDSDLRAIRVRNLVDDLLNRTLPGDLAQALLDVDLLRSAQYAGLEFERRLRDFAEVHDPDYRDEDCLYDVIQTLSEKRMIDPVRTSFWHKARKVRNRAAHGRAPSRIDVKFLLETLEDLAGFSWRDPPMSSAHT